MINFIFENAPSIVTVIFFTAFCYITFSTLKKNKKKELEKYAKIPLKDQEL